jgi:hypothetical protein
VIVCGVVRREPTARASADARVTWLAQVTPLARDTREFATRIARGDRARGETVRLNLRSTRWTRWTVVGGRRRRSTVDVTARDSIPREFLRGNG